MEVNLLDHLDDESLWQESFWVLRDVVLKCITLNSYLKTFKKPQDIYVSHYDINQEVKEMILQLILDFHSIQHEFGRRDGSDNDAS